MARLPVSPDALVAQFGPSLGFPPKEGFPGRAEAKSAGGWGARGGGRTRQ